MMITGVNQAGLSKVKHIIAIASGKGGVGKSTTAVNVALALASDGNKVGIVDADIYGPSIPIMLGATAETKPKIVDKNFFLPIERLGLYTMSIGYLMTKETPVVWRGPMATGALMQMLTQTIWGSLDYLIVDMPPGTGDIQLTLAQKAKLSGAVIITTPQDVALLDARRAIEMFKKVNIPVLGVIENMAIHVCSQCGRHEYIFGKNGAETIASEYKSEVLGVLPLSIDIREHIDQGKPCVYANPESDISKIYYQTIGKITQKLADITAPSSPEIITE
jgi:ATP-binding protein involved in chromosome partitioning